jgi:hypothetical protein
MSLNSSLWLAAEKGSLLEVIEAIHGGADISYQVRIVQIIKILFLNKYLFYHSTTFG